MTLSSLRAVENQIGELKQLLSSDPQSDEARAWMATLSHLAKTWGSRLPDSIRSFPKLPEVVLCFGRALCMLAADDVTLKTFRVLIALVVLNVLSIDDNICLTSNYTLFSTENIYTFRTYKSCVINIS